MDLRTILVPLMICIVLTSLVFAAGCSGSNTSTPPATVSNQSSGNSTVSSSTVGNLWIRANPDTLHPRIYCDYSEHPSSDCDNYAAKVTAPVTYWNTPYGNYKIRAVLAGYPNKTIEVNFTSDGQKIVFDYGSTTNATQQSLGSILVTSEPYSATVYLDNEKKGVTPVTLNSVAAGEHTLLLQLSGYQDETVDVKSNNDYKKFDVVMKPVATTAATTSATTYPTTYETAAATTAATTAATETATTSVTTAATTAATTTESVTVIGVSPTYLHVSPSGSASTQTISITGTGLTTPAGMKLISEDTITATTYTASSDSSASGTFQVPSGTTGTYSVVLVDSAGTTLTTSTATVAIVSY